MENRTDFAERRSESSIAERRRGERRCDGAAVTAATTDLTLKNRVIDTLRTVFDPEIPINIYDLGLIYSLEIDEESHEGETSNVFIRMTLTAAACPVAHTFPATVCEAVQALDGVGEVEVELVWEPAWSREMMSEAARLQLGMM